MKRNKKNKVPKVTQQQPPMETPLIIEEELEDLIDPNLDFSDIDISDEVKIEYTDDEFGFTVDTLPDTGSDLFDLTEEDLVQLEKSAREAKSKREQEAKVAQELLNKKKENLEKELKKIEETIDAHHEHPDKFNHVSLNQVILIGYVCDKLGYSCENSLRVVSEDSDYWRFYRFNNILILKTERDNDSDYHIIGIIDKLSEYTIEKIHIGSIVYVKGNIQSIALGFQKEQEIKSYHDKVIIADEIQFIRQEHLYFSLLYGFGTLCCYDCGYKEDIVSEFGDSNDLFSIYMSDCQCQTCGQINQFEYYYSDSQKQDESHERECSCGGQLSRDKFIFCPQCKSTKMDYYNSGEPYLIGNFLKEWGEKFKKISCMLQYLHTFQSRALSDLKIEDLITPTELYRHQSDWLWLYSKIQGKEKEFFKPYWIPIQRSVYEYFIDISDDRFPIIDTYFDYIDESYQWKKIVFFNSITDLMLIDRIEVDLKQYKWNKTLEKYDKYID